MIIEVDLYFILTIIFMIFGVFIFNAFLSIHEMNKVVENHEKKITKLEFEDRNKK